jgi:hypothetical protein
MKFRALHFVGNYILPTWVAIKNPAFWRGSLKILKPNLVF